MRFIRRDKEKGASLVEVGIVLPMLVVLAVGLAEVGFLVIDYVTVTNAARSGARTGSTAADDPGADAAILEVVEEDICNLRFGDLNSVKISIYEPQADGSMPTLPSSLINEYTNSGSLLCGSIGHGFSCSNGCPWAPTSRDNSLPSVDEIGIQIEYDHQTITGLMPWLDKERLVDRSKN